MTRGVRSSLLLPLVGLVIAAATLAGCGASPAVRAAEGGDLTALRRTINEDVRRGEMSVDDARAVARAIASRDIEKAAEPGGGDRVREARPCARSVSDALEKRATNADEIGGVAAMVLLEEGLASRDDMALRASRAERKATSPSAAAAWRAVRARTLTRLADGAERRALLLDGDQEVRVAAAMAALDAARPSDADALIEAARLDPYPAARAVAIRSLGAIGGERLVLALKDMWALADEPKRQVIIAAWAMPPSIDVGGRRELMIVAEADAGTPSLAAAIALARAGGEGSASANGVIARAVATGTTRDRVYAISASPLGSDAVREAIVKAQGDPDEAVMIAALARQLDQSDAWRSKGGSVDRGAIVAKLLKIARVTPDSASGRSALSVLARSRVSLALPLIERDASSQDPNIRESAGLSFVALGELTRASLIAADAEPHVRTKVACAILKSKP